MQQESKLMWLRRSLMIAAALVLGLALFSAGPRVTFAQGGGEYWAEVNIGGPRTVFIPAECVSGISVERQGADAAPDMSEINWGAFERATIVCDTPLYDLPGGSEIEGELIHQGSSWLVNPNLWPSLSRAALQGETGDQPTDTDDADDAAERARPPATSLRWAEIQLTPTAPRVYVPAECVVGLPFLDTLTWTTSRDASIDQAQDEADDELDFGELWLGTMTCSTGVYATPGGTQIAGVGLIAGQSWFVSPYLWATTPPRTAPAATVEDTAATTDSMETADTDDADDLNS